MDTSEGDVVYVFDRNKRVSVVFAGGAGVVVVGGEERGSFADDGFVASGELDSFGDAVFAF